MKEKLVFFTRSYPYGLEETFIESEILVLSKYYKNIVILPLEEKPGRRPVPVNVQVLAPMFKEKNKCDVFFKALSLFFHLRLWLPLLRALGNGGELKHLIIASRMRSYLKTHKINQDIKADWYFYWGVNQANYLVFYDVPNTTYVKFHRYDLYEDRNHRIPFRKELLSRINFGICISRDGLDFIKKEYPAYSNKLHLFKLGTQDSGLNPNIRNDEFILVSISNLFPVKRVHLIADALRHSNLKIKWIHFGDGPEKELVNQSISKLPGNIEASFVGRKKNTEVIEFFKTQHIDLFINVSSSEGLPVSIMEAMSFGVPVLATNVGGSGEIVNNDSGMLVDKDISDKDLALAIEKILTDENVQDLRDTARKNWESDYCAFRNYEKLCNFLIQVKTTDLQ